MINFMGGFGTKKTEEPQENQYQGDTPSKPDNSTSWMAPASDQSNTADTGAQAPQGPPQQQQTGGGSTDGTALSSAYNGSWHNAGAATAGGLSNNTGINGGASWQQPQQTPNYAGSQEQQGGGAPAPPQGNPGRVGQYMPEGYDTTKFSDTANANTTKYQVGRILSQYPPGPEGLQQASAELAKLGISVQGRDKIRLPDGTTTDVGKSFSDPNAQHAWQYNWSGPGGDGGGGNQMNPQSMLGQQQGQQGFQGGMNPQMIMQMLQQMQGQQGGMRTQPKPFDFGSSQMNNNSPEIPGGIAQSQGNMMGQPQLPQAGGIGMPQGSMGIRAPDPNNPFANNPNVRF